MLVADPIGCVEAQRSGALSEQAKRVLVEAAAA